MLSSVAFATLVAALPLTAACNRSDAPDYEARVQDNLKSAQLDDVRADWNQDEKALRLSGEVERAADKARAEELAQQVVGTSGRVINEVKIEGTNADDADDRIETELDRAFKEDDQWDMDTLDLSFDAKAGVVTITGSAPSEAVKNRITDRVKAVDGVTDVVNNLEIKPEKSGAASDRPKQ